jgi:hypothetical protein
MQHGLKEQPKSRRHQESAQGTHWVNASRHSQKEEKSQSVVHRRYRIAPAVGSRDSAHHLLALCVFAIQALVPHPLRNRLCTELRHDMPLLVLCRLSDPRAADTYALYALDQLYFVTPFAPNPHTPAHFPNLTMEWYCVYCTRRTDKQCIFTN